MIALTMTASPISAHELTPLECEAIQSYGVSLADFIERQDIAIGDAFRALGKIRPYPEEVEPVSRGLLAAMQDGPDRDAQRRFARAMQRLCR